MSDVASISAVARIVLMEANMTLIEATIVTARDLAFGVLPENFMRCYFSPSLSTVKCMFYGFLVQFH